VRVASGGCMSRLRQAAIGTEAATLRLAEAGLLEGPRRERGHLSSPAQSRGPDAAPVVQRIHAVQRGHGQLGR
jgi:hypothetical protein